MKNILILGIITLLTACSNKGLQEIDPRSEDRVSSEKSPLNFQIDNVEVVDELDPRYKFIFESKIKSPITTQTIYNGVLQATGIALLGNNKMVITYNTKDSEIKGGIDIVDISSLTNPVVIKTFILQDMEFSDSKILGNKLYLSGVDENLGAILLTVDLSNQMNPQILDKKVLSSFYATSLSLMNNNLLVTTGDKNGHVYSFNIGSNGIPVEQYKDSFQNALYVKHFKDGYLVLNDQNGSTILSYKNKVTNSLENINLLNKHFEAPSRFDYYNDTIFTLTEENEKILVLDYSTKQVVKNLSVSGRGNGIKFEDGLLYTAQGDQGFRLFDVRDLNNVIDVGRFDFNDQGAGNNVWTYTVGTKRVVIVSDGLDGVKILSQDLNSLPQIQKVCQFATKVENYSPQGNIANDRKDSTKALGSPQGDQGPNINFVSLGKSGSITLSFDVPVKNAPNKTDLRVFETTWNNDTFSTYPEQAEVYGSNDGTSWTYLGLVKNENGNDSLGEIELGNMTEAKFIKIVDKTTWSGSPDGFDVDAVQCLNQPINNTSQIFGKDYGILFKDGVTKKIYRLYINESGKKVAAYANLDSQYSDSHIGLTNDGRYVVELSGNNKTKFTVHDLATKSIESSEDLAPTRLTQVVVDPNGDIMVGNPKNDQLYKKVGFNFHPLGHVYYQNKKIDIAGADIAFFGKDLYLATQSKGGRIFRVVKNSNKYEATLLFENVGLISGLAVFRDSLDGKVKFLASILRSETMTLLYEDKKINLKLEGEIVKQSNSGDLAVRNNEYDKEEIPCEETTNFIKNPSFEILDERVGIVNNTKLNQLTSWDVYRLLPSEKPGIDSWITELGSGIEVQKNGVSSDTKDGNYLIELDSHSNQTLGSNTNIKVYQNIVLDAGKYVLKFNYKPRRNLLNDSRLVVKLDDSVISDVSSIETVWKEYSLELNIPQGSHKLSFEEAGIQNSYGSLLDMIYLNKKCQK